MKALNFYSVSANTQIVQPTLPTNVTLDSPASLVLTDFTVREPFTVTAQLSATHAEQLMRMEHVKLALVTGANEQLLGAVSVDDLSGEAVIKRVASGYSREDLKVQDFMRPLSSLKAMAFSELRQATLRDLVAALSESGQQHCLVVDQGGEQVRGLISSSDLARVLKLPIDIQSRSSFVAVFKAIRGSAAA